MACRRALQLLENRQTTASRCAKATPIARSNLQATTATGDNWHGLSSLIRSGSGLALIRPQLRRHRKAYRSAGLVNGMLAI